MHHTAQCHCFLLLDWFLAWNFRTSRRPTTAVLWKSSYYRPVNNGGNHAYCVITLYKKRMFINSLCRYVGVQRMRQSRSLSGPSCRSRRFSCQPLSLQIIINTMDWTSNMNRITRHFVNFELVGPLCVCVLHTSRVDSALSDQALKAQFLEPRVWRLLYY